MANLRFIHGSGAVLAALWGMGCAAGGQPDDSDGAAAGGDNGDLFGPTTCAAGQIVCDGSVARVCDGHGGFDEPRDCSAEGKQCAASYGCVSCVPFTNGTCQDGVATMCDATGEGTAQFECDPGQGMTCAPDGCHGACSPMELQGSYIGCEYWPTVTWNGALSKWFHFAAAVANASPEVANVEVTRGAESVAKVTIAPGSLEIIKLPWVKELKGEDSGSGILVSLPHQSVLAKGGAYRLRSDHPVTVYQWNALEYHNTEAPVAPVCEDPTVCCPDPTKAGGCFSYSNDASLLLPTSSLTANYTVLGYRTVTSGLSAMYDTVAITAPRDGTEVAFLVTTPAAPGGPFGGLSAGQTGQITLNAGDVFELLSVGVSLSGSRVWSPNGQPFQLIGGMPAAEITDGVHATDHIEEVIVPAEALGKDYAVTAPTTPLGKRIHTVRIQGLLDSTTLTFDPPSFHEDVTLAGWDTLELDSVTEDFRVSATTPFGVTQYMHGEGLGPQQEGAAGAGDPSQSLVVPTQQYRTSYVFLAPADYDQNYVNITAPEGAKVVLDGTAVPDEEFTAVGSNGMRVARHLLDAREFHEATSEQPFGIVVYGYGSYTSYMLPGGLDVKHIAQLPTPK